MALKCLSTLTMWRKPRVAAATVMIITAAAATAACGTSEPSISCVQGEDQYRGHCLQKAAVDFLECSEGQGYQTYSKISGSIKGTYMQIGTASIDAAYEEGQKQSDAAALKIIESCLIIVGARPDTPQQDRAVSVDLSGRTVQRIVEIRGTTVAEEPHLEAVLLENANGVGLTGINFDAHEIVDVFMDGASVGQPPGQR